MSTSKPARNGDYRLLWTSLLVFGLVGLSLNAFGRKAGMANRFVKIESMERIEVADVSTVVAGSSRTAIPEITEWVDPKDPRIAAGAVKPIPGVAPITWQVRSLVSAKDAAATDEARANGDASAPEIVRSPIDSIGVWVAAFLTLGIFSFLYRDNPWYKIAESVLIGVSAAYWMTNAFWSTLVPNLFGKLVPDIVREIAIPKLLPSESPNADFALAVVPLILGFMLIWRLAPRGGWISVWPIAFIIGTTAGLKLVSAVEADLVAQAVATMKPLVVLAQSSESATTAANTINFWGTVGSVVGLIGVMTVLVYFFFSLEHKGAVGKTARVGVWFLMITFGSAFGLTVMGRITLLAQRFEFLFNDWLNIG